MADEIKINLNVRASKNNINVVPEPINVSIDQTTAGGGGPAYVTVATTETTISFGATVPGLVLLQNLDTTNFVNYGTVAGNLGQYLSAQGEPNLIGLKTGETLRMIADTDPCKVKVIGINL